MSERTCSNPNCGTNTTPSWRRIKGKIFCNACAVYSFRHQGELRPSRKRKNLQKGKNTTKQKTKRKKTKSRICIGKAKHSTKQKKVIKMKKQRTISIHQKNQQTPIVKKEKILIKKSKTHPQQQETEEQISKKKSTNKKQNSTICKLSVGQQNNFKYFQVKKQNPLSSSLKKISPNQKNAKHLKVEPKPNVEMKIITESNIQKEFKIDTETSSETESETESESESETESDTDTQTETGPESNYETNSEPETETETETETSSETEIELKLKKSIKSSKPQFMCTNEEFHEISRRNIATLQVGDCVGMTLQDGLELFAVIRQFVKEKNNNYQTTNSYCQVTWLVPKTNSNNLNSDPMSLSLHDFMIGPDEPLPQSIRCITRKLNFRVKLEC
ncbi:hypothetical protein M0812_03104 [Anaeramoeba flamelloides]|uniref:GATA-type domain-containing protein n=1 Tax=Anaeramoeba flamelloides TaxID=1746091 RepID=A0AAV7YRT7_9EUKA|nr:hypothetical protein M0812_03104 [Anaeramoeba flamelloides]